MRIFIQAIFFFLLAFCFSHTSEAQNFETNLAAAEKGDARAQWEVSEYYKNGELVE